MSQKVCFFIFEAMKDKMLFFIFFYFEEIKCPLYFWETISSKELYTIIKSIKNIIQFSLDRIFCAFFSDYKDLKKVYYFKFKNESKLFFDFAKNAYNKWKGCKNPNERCSWTRICYLWRKLNFSSNKKKFRPLAKLLAMIDFVGGYTWVEIPHICIHGYWFCLL